MMMFPCLSVEDSAESLRLSTVPAWDSSEFDSGNGQLRTPPGSAAAAAAAAGNRAAFGAPATAGGCAKECRNMPSMFRQRAGTGN
jgi:hypothetical protein